MIFANITVDGKYVNKEMLEEGLATLQSQRRDEPNPYYSILLSADKNAKQSKRGIHSPKPASNPSFVNLMDKVDDKTLSYYQEYFRKNVDNTGIVEYCFNGSKFKVRIDAAKCYVAFICDRVSAPSQESELQEVNEAAKKFARERLMQREVGIKVNSSDRRGNCYGVLSVGGKNYAVMLLEEGLALVDAPRKKEAAKKDEYEEAVERAKKNKKGMHSAKKDKKDKEDNKEEVKSNPEGEIRAIEGKERIEIDKFTDSQFFYVSHIDLSLIHICRCRRYAVCRSRWSPYQ
eukprot:TRINITY_DN3430_c0_g1_i1.p1 TRINITY_DN3430_c0_g1~~TRINITY_DN3430_c0_g1_i1.p1  ORF type:complete len:289 (-),score=94.12 TRINITY_DN3430_c0_g1_i1:16-882(-)